MSNKQKDEYWYEIGKKVCDLANRRKWITYYVVRPQFAESHTFAQTVKFSTNNFQIQLESMMREDYPSSSYALDSINPPVRLDDVFQSLKPVAYDKYYRKFERPLPNRLYEEDKKMITKFVQEFRQLIQQLLQDSKLFKFKSLFQAFETECTILNSQLNSIMDQLANIETRANL